MTSRSKIWGSVSAPEGAQRMAVGVPACVRESSPNNRLQATVYSVRSAPAARRA
jgi:hypothetical protein